MRLAFEVAGGGRLPESELNANEQYTNTIYLIADSGSFENDRNLMCAAKALLKCGGTPVKIESTGFAYLATCWDRLADDELSLAVLNGFVTYIGGDGEFYWCGMHSIGHPDADVAADISPNDAANLLHQFVRYIAVEEPTIHDNETFGPDEDAPKYRMCKSPCTMFPAVDLFYNSSGVWQLSPVYQMQQNHAVNRSGKVGRFGIRYLFVTTW